MNAFLKQTTVVLFFITCLAVHISAEAKHLHPEKYYQEIWCAEHNGEAEVRLPDGTRADCITKTHAVEHDFAPKWAESIGQALYYSIQTGKRAGIGLIIESPKDRKHWIRLNTTIDTYGLLIDTWEIN